MPRYMVETTAQVRRVYMIEADTADAAEKIAANADPGQYLTHEEDVSEEIDSVAEAAAAD